MQRCNKKAIRFSFREKANVRYSIILGSRCTIPKGQVLQPIRAESREHNVAFVLFPKSERSLPESELIAHIMQMLHGLPYATSASSCFVRKSNVHFNIHFL